MTLMGTGAGDIENEYTEHTEDMDWARELFDRARGGGEPVWSGADVAVIARSGDRRRRLRAVGTGGGLLGVVAVTVAAAMTLGAGTADPGSRPGPGAGWGGRQLQDVFQYAQVTGGGGGVSADFYEHVPRAAAADVAALIGHLDPAGAHLKGSAQGPARAQPRIVSDGDPVLKEATSFTMDSTWTADGSFPDRTKAAVIPYARLSYEFFNDANVLLGRGVGFTSNAGPPPCGYAVDRERGFRLPGSTATAPQWSTCRRTVLADGSTVGVTSARFGGGTETVAVRVFGSGQVMALLGWDYPWPRSGDLSGPADAGSVVTPAPWTEDSVLAALSDPELAPVLPPRPQPNPGGKMLAPSDLGAGWGYDLTKGQGSTGEFVMDDGCAPDASIFGLAAGKALDYTGNLPDGTPATAFEGEYRLPAGTGAQTMQNARKHSQGGCDPSPAFGFSKDTMSDLPSGIGDGAFIENQPQQGAVRVTVRFGDTILQTIITRNDHQTLDLTSTAGKTWLEGIARQMAAHWTGDQKSTR